MRADADYGVLKATIGDFASPDCCTPDLVGAARGFCEDDVAGFEPEYLALGRREIHFENIAEIETCRRDIRGAEVLCRELASMPIR